MTNEFEKLLNSGMSESDTHLPLTAKHKADLRFLREFVFTDLTDLNIGFDSPLICHVSPADFLVVIARCEAHHVRVIGIEVFSPDATQRIVEFVGMNIPIPPEDGYEWARTFVRQYLDEPNITICASFEVPDSVGK
jgi:hypothetical protein